MISFSFHAKLQRFERRPGASLYRSSLYWYGIYLLIPDAEWLPYMMNHLEIGYVRQRKRWPAAALLRENQIYVACQTSDDLPYILDHMGMIIWSWERTTATTIRRLTSTPCAN
ncbi:MAG: hypothetical protein ACXW6R_19255 [Candidatus Binatia bacterium]